MSRFKNSDGKPITRTWVRANVGSWSGFKRAVAEHQGVEYDWHDDVPREYMLAFLVYQQGLTEEQAQRRIQQAPLVRATR